MAVSARTRVTSELVEDLPSFIGVLAELADRLISATATGKHQDPGLRAWRRKISSFLDKNSTSLIQSFTHWLEHTNKVYIFALFGTLLEMSPAMVAEMEQSSALDLIFHGAGCMAFVVQRVMGTTRSRNRFRECFALGAQQRYDNICRLLSMASRANKDIQDGTLHDTYRLAYFGNTLHLLLPPDSGPVSPAITSIFNKMPQAPNGWSLFDTYFSVADRCSNPMRHCASNQSDSPKESFSVTIKLKVKRGDRILACSNCKCQREGWKDGNTPHRDICPILAKVYQVHQAKQIETPEQFEMMYTSAGISTAEVERAVGYVVQMMECFSHYIYTEIPKIQATLLVWTIDSVLDKLYRWDHQDNDGIGKPEHHTLNERWHRLPSEGAGIRHKLDNEEPSRTKPTKKEKLEVELPALELKLRRSRSGDADDLKYLNFMTMKQQAFNLTSNRGISIYTRSR
ncbi:hypothetical protein B0H13DRAFT_1873461 [Mycena leptocephala]|nr:hypothetical protein B0H13DRAFT_1873461 [Mycena leptocephala]